MKLTLNEYEIVVAVREYAERRGLLAQCTPDGKATIVLTSQRRVWGDKGVFEAEIAFPVVALDGSSKK